VLVVSDDLDQPPAAVRLRQKGGHGGHNGLRSIIQHLGGSHDFPRIKIGEELKESIRCCRCCCNAQRWWYE
jgi:peptidyl-tRNA hydrolase